MIPYLGGGALAHRTTAAPAEKSTETRAPRRLQPSLSQSGLNAKIEISYTESGSPSYEAGVAGGMHIIDGVIGMRVSIWFGKRLARAEFISLPCC